MDAYRYHVKFEQEIKRDVNQAHYLAAHYNEYKQELDRLKVGGIVKRETEKAKSMINETVYNRMLDWYKADSLLKTENFVQRLYEVVSDTRYAVIWCYTLAFLHAKN